MERAIIDAIKKSQEPHCNILETKLNEATSTLKLDAVQAAVAEALIRWAIAQPKVQEEASKQDAVVNWVDMGNRALNIISPAVSEAKSVSLEGVEAAAVITLLDWAVKQPEIGQQGHIMDYVGIAQGIITSNKAVKASPEELAAIDAEKAAAGAGAAAPAPVEQPEKSAEQGAPAAGPTPEEMEQTKYESLAERLFIVKILKEKKTALSEKETKFIAETEAIKLTDKERTIVMEKYNRISKGRVSEEGSEHDKRLMYIGKDKKTGKKYLVLQAGAGSMYYEISNKEVNMSNADIVGITGQIRISEGEVNEDTVDFSKYSLQDLFKVRDAAKVMEDLGVYLDTKMLEDLMAEIKKREQAGG